MKQEIGHFDRKSLEYLSVDFPLWGRRKAEMVSELRGIMHACFREFHFLNFSELGFLLKLLLSWFQVNQIFLFSNFDNVLWLLVRTLGFSSSYLTINCNGFALLLAERGAEPFIRANIFTKGALSMDHAMYWRHHGDYHIYSHVTLESLC